MAVILRPARERHVVKAAAADSVHRHQHMILEVGRAGSRRRASPASRRDRSPLGSSSWQNRRERSRDDAAVDLRGGLTRSADRGR